MPGKHVLASAKIPEHLKDRLRYALERISKIGVIELYYRRDRLVVINPQVITGQRRAKQLEKAGWENLGRYTIRDPKYMLEDVIEERTQYMNAQPLSPIYVSGGIGTADNWHP